MSSDSDDDWVITTKQTNLHNTTSTYLPTLNDEQHGERISPTVQQAITPPTFSRKHRHPSPSVNNNNYKSRSEQQYYPTVQSPVSHKKKPASPTPLLSTSRHASPNRHLSALTQTTPSRPHSASSIANGSNKTRKQEGIPAIDAPIPLHDIPLTAAPRQYVELLISTYKNSDQFIVLKDSGNTPHLFQHLADSLQLGDDPFTWIQMALLELGDYFAKHRLKNRDLTPKFQRLLVQAICRGLELYLDTPMAPQSTVDDTTPTEQQPAPDIPDLIIFTDGEEEEEESDLIDLSFDDETNGDDDDKDDGADEHDNDNDDLVELGPTLPTKKQPQQLSNEFSSLSLDTNGSNIIDIDTNGNSANSNKTNGKEGGGGGGDLLTTIHSEPATPADMKPQQHPHSLTKKHQVAFVDMIHKIEAPSIVYYAMDVFNATRLLMAGGEYETEGSLLSRQLLRQGFYNEAISCIMRLHLQANFPMTKLAEFLFNVGQGAILSVYTKDRPILKYSLLSFINVQLRYNFAGKLGVVDSELLEDVEKDNEHIPPLQRMRERRFQKELLNCGLKLIEQLDLPEDRYYFIWLSQRYTAIRWVISSRSAQQAAENDYSINASSNYNGLLELIAEEDPTLAKLVIKELVDLHDMIAAQHFSAALGQDIFFRFYQALPPNQRMLGIIRGEQISHGLSSYHGKKRNGGGYNNGGMVTYYKLPDEIRYLVVDDDRGLNEMTKSFMHCKRCGLDSEWVPTIAKSGKSRTALMQIATDDDMVYLLDLKTLLKPSNKRLLEKAEYTLQCIFESKVCTKLAYDFNGDLSLLGTCMPSVRNWKINNFKDMNKLRHYNNNKLGAPITGGLAGVVMAFLGVSMNKKQQLSNWEKRPLTIEQITYAACDAYCLLEIYDFLTKQGHPFSENIPIPSAKTFVPKLSVLDPSNPSTTSSTPTTETSALYMGVQETPSTHSPSPTFDLIQF